MFSIYYCSQIYYFSIEFCHAGYAGKSFANVFCNVNNCHWFCIFFTGTIFQCDFHSLRSPFYDSRVSFSLDTHSSLLPELIVVTVVT